MPVYDIIHIIKGNGQKRELPVGSRPETGGQKYEGSKHSIWAHVIGPTPPSTRFWPYTDRDLPILATLVSSHPVLATFCCIFLLFTSLFDLTSLA